MSTFSNLAGTMSDSFAIGKRGVKLLQGMETPTPALVAPIGSLYLKKSGDTIRVYQLVAAAQWEPLLIAGSIPFLVTRSDDNVPNAITLSTTGSLDFSPSTGTLKISNNPVFTGVGGLVPPVGSTAQRPSTPILGQFRYSTTLGRFEGYNGADWNPVGSVASVSLSTPSTGLSVTSGGPVTDSGTLTITLAGEIAALNALSTTGFVARTGTAAYSPRAITASSTAGAQGISLTNGNGVSGNPTVGLSITGLTAATSAATTNQIALFDGTNNVKATLAQVKTALAVPLIYRASFTNANLTGGMLPVVHNIGQQFVQVVVYDENNRVVLPDEITMTNATTSTIDFTSFGALTGTWNVMVIG